MFNIIHFNKPKHYYMKNTKLLFYLRRLYLRFNAGRPKKYTDEQIFKLGRKFWKLYCENHSTEISMECLWEFQSYAIKLSFIHQYALQAFFDEYLKELENNFTEHASATVEKLEKAYKEKIYAYRNAIC